VAVGAKVEVKVKVEGEKRKVRGEKLQVGGRRRRLEAEG